MKRKLNVLFVDDQARYRKSLVNEMADYGIDCAGEASNGIECLALLKREIPDVVLLDLEMPEMDGSSTFNAIKEAYPKLPVIILSQHDDTGLMENYLHRGAKGFIPKTLIDADVRTLEEGIKTIKAGATFFPSYNATAAISYTKKEVAIIPHLIDGKTSKEIATALGMGEKKVSKLRWQLNKKTNTRNAPEFVKYGVLKGLKYLDKR